MDEGRSAEDVFASEPLKAPPTLTTLARWTGRGKDLLSKPQTRGELIRFVSFIAGLQAILYMLAYLMKGMFSFMTRQTIIVMSRLIEYDLKEAIYDQYQRLPAAFYKQNATGDLMNRISEDVSKVRMYLGPAVMYGLTLVTMMFLTVGVMLRIDVTLDALLFGPFALDEFRGVQDQRPHSPQERCSSDSNKAS